MASNGLTHATRKSLAMGPSVRNLLTHYQIDPTRITSTGPHQTILKCDVLKYIDQNSLRPSASGQSSTVQSNTTTTTSAKAKVFTPNLDLSGYQPKPGREGFSKQAKKLLDT